PMNCPGHVQIFKNGLKSYRDLPLKIAEFGKVHRFEPSGALHGLMRVRAFTQDDAHVFITEGQIAEESLKINDLILSIYQDFGFSDVTIKFSDRPEKRIGEDAIWDKSEAALMEALKASGRPWTLNKGEGAFYGPKLEYILRAAICRSGCHRCRRSSPPSPTMPTTTRARWLPPRSERGCGSRTTCATRRSITRCANTRWQRCLRCSWSDARKPPIARSRFAGSV